MNQIINSLSLFRGCAIALMVMLVTNLGYAEEVDTFYVKEPVFGTLVYMKEAGKEHDETVVLVHGLGDLGSLDWQTVIPVLASKYHVVTFDLPGFGFSEKDSELYSPTQYAYFIKWVIDHYTSYKNHKPITLVGHSMGGAISLRYAAMYPETLRRLILVDAAGILHRSAFAKANVQERFDASRWLGDLFKGEVESVGNWLADMVVKADQIPLPIETILKTKELRRTVLAGSPTAIAALALLEENFSQAIYHLRVPTRIIWGRDDKIAPLRTGRLLDARLRQSQLVIIDDAGHVPMKTQPRKFNDLLMSSLASENIVAGREKTVLSKGIGVCNGESGQIFTGTYKKIIIHNCEDVILDKAWAGKIEIINSDVKIYQTKVVSEHVGMMIKDSRVIATALDIHADVGVMVTASKLDFAGVVIDSKKEAIKSESAQVSKVVISVSAFDSMISKGYIHGVFNISLKRAM